MTSTGPVAPLWASLGSKESVAPIRGALASALALFIGVSPLSCTGVLGGDSGGSAAAGTSQEGGHGSGESVDILNAPDLEDEIASAPPFAAAPSTLRRITPAQYANVVVDLFGEDVPLPTDLESIARVDGSDEIGAAAAFVQTKAAKEYERSAFAIASWLFSNPSARERLGVCSPVSAEDDCVREYFSGFTSKAWRRRASEEELDALVALVRTVDADLNDADQSFSYAVAAVLLSPNFLYRPELGEPDPDEPERLRFTSVEMASRLSFALWGSIPDPELFEAGENGDLLDAEKVAAQAERLLASPRASQTLLMYLRALFEVDQLENLQKNADLFPSWDSQLADSAMEEASEFLATLSAPDKDFREIFSSSNSFMNSQLADFYGIDVALGGELSPAAYPESSGRVGLLGTAAWLARHAGSETPSPMGRGHAVRRIFLCQHIELPPNLAELIEDAEKEQAGAVDEGLANGLTLARSESAARMASPICSSCHSKMDPIGLALENFDASGAFREDEEGVPIDPTGEFDGIAFDGLLGMAALLAESPLPMRCLTENAYAHLNGHHAHEGEEVAVLELKQAFEESQFSIRSLLARAVSSDGFRYAAPSETE